jgi:hypothetical protein
MSDRKPERSSACSKAEYTKFSQRMSEELARTHPGLSFEERSRLIKKSWRAQKGKSAQAKEQPLQGSETEPIGPRTVYHATSKEIAQQILSAGSMSHVTRGAFGTGFYFEDTVEQAREKSGLGSAAVAIQATVDFGVAAVLNRPDKTITLERLRSADCDSVKGRSSTGQQWEYVVYEQQRITGISQVGSGGSWLSTIVKGAIGTILTLSAVWTVAKASEKKGK